MNEMGLDLKLLNTANNLKHALDQKARDLPSCSWVEDFGLLVLAPGQVQLADTPVRFHFAWTHSTFIVYSKIVVQRPGQMNILDYLDRESPEISRALTHGFRRGDADAVGRALVKKLKHVKS